MTNRINIVKKRVVINEAKFTIFEMLLPAVTSRFPSKFFLNTKDL